MSRIGRRPIAIPSGVTIQEREGEVEVKGPNGTLRQPLPRGIRLEVEGEEARLHRADEKRDTRAAHGLARALLSNMVNGVTSGFAKELEVQGVGYRADVSGGSLKLSVGYSQPIEVAIPEGLSVTTPENRVRIEGSSRERVGQFAADVRSVRPPEPYKGKGIRYVDERVRRKVGKAGS